MAGRASYDYEGESAIVTGSTRGIGRGIATGLADAGANVVVNTRTESDVQAVAEELDDRDDGAVIDVTADISDPGEIEGLVDTAVDQFDDPRDLHIASRVDGKTMQDDNTGMMIRTVADLVAFASSRGRLEPSNVIATGTPEGVGTFQDIKLADGETLKLEIDGIGTLVNTVEAVED